MENKAIVKTQPVNDIRLWKKDWKAQLSLIQVNKDMTFPELRKLDTPSISLMNLGEKSPDNGIRIFQALVLNIVKFLGAEWSTQQVLDCGKICFDEANYLTFAELSHFAQRAKFGYFDKVYGKFTPATFIEWFTTYVSENLEERAGYFGAKKPEWQEPENPIDPEYIKLAISDMAHRFCEGGVNDQIEANKTREMIDQSVKKFKETVTEGQLHEEYDEIKKSETNEAA